MSKIDELIQELCPDGVPYQPLGDLADLNWGDTNTTKQSFAVDINGFTAYSASGPDGILSYFDYDREAVIISAIGALAGKTWYAEGKWSCIKNTIRFFSLDESKVTTKFLYWYTSTDGFWPRRGSAQPFISKGDADKILIAVPPVQIQDHIVRVLDAFAGLMAELEAELEARQEQLRYFRESIVAGSNGEEFNVEDIVILCTPPVKIPKNNYESAGRFPIIDQSKNYISGYTNDDSALLLQPPYVLFGDHTCEIKYSNDVFAQGADGLKILKAKELIRPSYLFHLLKSIGMETAGYQRHWSILKKRVVRVPSLELQDSIISQLDVLQELTQSLTTGLPAELKSRRKQLEFYRDKLLTFKELAA